MNDSKEFTEGKEAALRGDLRFPNPYKGKALEQYSNWSLGWWAGKDEKFNNMLPEEKSKYWEERSKYWEERWRQSELEKYKAFEFLSKLGDLSEEVWESPPTMDNPYDKVIYESKWGKITLGDCCEADHFMMRNPPADIKTGQDNLAEGA